MAHIQKITPQDVMKLVERILLHPTSSDQLIPSSSQMNNLFPLSQFRNSNNYAHYFKDTQQASQSQMWHHDDDHVVNDQEEREEDEIEGELMQTPPEQAKAKLRYNTNLLATHNFSSIPNLSPF